MSINKRSSAYPNINQVPDLYNFVLNGAGGNWNVAFSVLKYLLTSGITGAQVTVCPAGESTPINLGDNELFRGFTIDYIAKVGTTRLRAGIVKIIQSDSVQIAGEIANTVTIPNDGEETLNMTFGAAVTNGQLQLIIINEDSSDISFEFTQTAFNL